MICTACNKPIVEGSGRWCGHEPERSYHWECRDMAPPLTPAEERAITGLFNVRMRKWFSSFTRQSVAFKGGT